MKVTVQFTTQLKAAIGKADDTIELDDDATVRSLITELDQRYSQAFRQFAMDAKGNFLPSVFVCINDAQCTGTVYDQILSDGDQVALVSAISGG